MVLKLITNGLCRLLEHLVGVLLTVYYLFQAYLTAFCLVSYQFPSHSYFIVKCYDFEKDLLRIKLY